MPGLPAGAYQLEKWDKFSYGKDAVIDLLQLSDDPTHQAYVQRLSWCAKELHFATFQTADGRTIHKLVKANFCRVPCCPICQWRRSARYVAQYRPVFDELATEFPKHHWWFLTLTVKEVHVSELLTTFKAMRMGWRRMQEDPRWPAIGAIRTFEITFPRREDDNEAFDPLDVNPHFHALILCPASYSKNGGRRYLSEYAWGQLWAESMKLGYLPQVDVTHQNHGDLLGRLSYITKPIIVDPCADAPALLAIDDQLRNTRRFEALGTLRGRTAKYEHHAAGTLDAMPLGEEIRAWNSDLNTYVKKSLKT